MRKRRSGPVVVPDSYEPATLDVAWAEYRDAHPSRNNPDGYATFRAGFRRGVAQGALLATSTFVHNQERRPHDETALAEARLRSPSAMID